MPGLPVVHVTRSDTPAPGAVVALSLTAEAEVIPAATISEEETP